MEKRQKEEGETKAVVLSCSGSIVRSCKSRRQNFTWSPISQITGTDRSMHVFVQHFSFAKIKWNDHRALHGSSFLPPSHTGDLSRLTVTYFGCRFFKQCLPPCKTSTQPDPLLSPPGLFGKTASRPPAPSLPLSDRWLWKFTLTFWISTFWAICRCYLSTVIKLPSSHSTKLKEVNCKLVLSRYQNVLLWY